MRIGPQLKLPQIRQSIPIRVLARVAGVVRVQTVRALPFIGHPIIVRIIGNEHRQRIRRLHAFIDRLDDRRPARHGRDQPAGIYTRDVGIARQPQRALARARSVGRAAVAKCHRRRQLHGLAFGRESVRRAGNGDGNRLRRNLAEGDRADDGCTVGIEHEITRLSESSYAARSASDTHPEITRLNRNVVNPNRAARTDLHAAIQDCGGAVFVEHLRGARQRRVQKHRQ